MLTYSFSTTHSICLSTTQVSNQPFFISVCCTICTDFIWESRHTMDNICYEFIASCYSAKDTSLHAIATQTHLISKIQYETAMLACLAIAFICYVPSRMAKLPHIGYITIPFTLYRNVCACNCFFFKHNVVFLYIYILIWSNWHTHPPLNTALTFGVVKDE